MQKWLFPSITLFAIQIVFFYSKFINLFGTNPVMLFSPSWKQADFIFCHFYQQVYFLFDNVFKSRNYYSLPSMLSRHDTSWAKRRNTGAMWNIILLEKLSRIANWTIMATRLKTKFWCLVFINPFQADDFFLYLWKHQKTKRFLMYQEVSKGNIGLKLVWHVIPLFQKNLDITNSLHLVRSFVEFVPYVLELHGVDYFLSDKPNQDPVEEHFGRIRNRGGGNDNPTLKQYGFMNRKVIVAKSEMIQATKGNNRGCVKENITVEVHDERQLPKRQIKNDFFSVENIINIIYRYYFLINI